jgi:hypothetical protein
MIGQYSVKRIKHVENILLSVSGTDPKSEKELTELADLIKKDSSFLFFSDGYDLTNQLQKNFLNQSFFNIFFESNPNKRFANQFRSASSQPFGVLY